uniref:Uncharacterized protein n=1 Tax=Panagrolaimus sp. ES5 TaxID=591445 RepID=A0AC34G7U5_9BILA
MDQMSLNFVPGNMLIGKEEDSEERQKGATIMDQMSLNFVPGNMLIGKEEDSEERRKVQFLPAVRDGIVDLDLTELIIETLEKVVRANVPEDFVIGVKLSTAKFQAADVDYDGFMKVLKKVEVCNYDFVELAGGSIEFPLEAAASRESLFSQVMTSAKSHVSNIPIFLTGGFRTVAAMENAISSGNIDGVGLGRPAASEFVQFLPAVRDGIVDLDLTERIIETLEKVVRANVKEDFVIGVKLSTAKFQAADVDYDGFMKVLKKVELCNYDFVELAGGSIEFPLEAANSRESLFSQVMTSAKSHVPKIPIFLTGGFRTVAAMEKAISSGNIDGIGLGRPAASEFGKKVFLE